MITERDFQWNIPGQYKELQNSSEGSNLINNNELEYDGDTGRKNNHGLQLLTLEHTGHSIREEEAFISSEISESKDEKLTKKSPVPTTQLNGEINRQLNVTKTRYRNVEDEKQKDPDSMQLGQKQESQPSTSSNLDESSNPCNADKEHANPYLQAIPFKRGDSMRTISPETIG